ncbi:hypothetical protein [Streptomyces atroolivaceus]|uniref:hypothetical protein n=1 Tax=Streptomyces atroolivaceus TaxID=66869 RepID=UPI0036C02738
MDEAERLSDRIAAIDGGGVAAVDTPAGLIAQSSAVQQVRFRVSQPLDKSVLTGLPDVTDVEIPTAAGWSPAGDSFCAVSQGLSPRLRSVRRISVPTSATSTTRSWPSRDAPPESPEPFERRAD